MSRTPPYQENEEDPRTRAMLAGILEVCFPNGMPARLERLVDLQRSSSRLADYKLNPVVCLGADRAVRLSYSDAGERDCWRAHLTKLWNHPHLQHFLEQAPPQTRRMVDSDGSTGAVVYLDDLQDVATEAPKLQGLICSCLHLPAGTRSHIARSEAVPAGILEPRLRRQVDLLQAEGVGGLWGVRRRGAETLGVLWVTESRWRDTAEETALVLERLQPPRLWYDLRECARRHGGQAYPDAVELLPDGTADVTVGFLPPVTT